MKEKWLRYQETKTAVVIEVMLIFPINLGSK